MSGKKKCKRRNKKIVGKKNWFVGNYLDLQDWESEVKGLKTTSSKSKGGSVGDTAFSLEFDNHENAG